jgi:hypothetical protein
MRILNNPIASNVLESGEVLYTKIHGMKYTFAAGEVKVFNFTVPYTKCLFMGAEIVHEVETTTDMNLKVPDGQGGYAITEQYGYAVNTGKDKYTKESPFGATIGAGIELECTVTNTSAMSMDIGVNFLLYDVRTPTP